MAVALVSRSRRTACSIHFACERSLIFAARGRYERHGAGRGRSRRRRRWPLETDRGQGVMSAASDVATIPGWYGKLPTLGDFASRRLEADFIEPWDLWLGEGLQGQRESMGDAWLDAYLQSPPWRFLLMPGVLPGFDAGLIVAGVLMPSVDRVGR